MVDVGYKYICWDIGDENAEIYMQKVEQKKPIHHSELTDCRGMEDKEEMPGIYFCESLSDLFIWLKELFDYVDPSAIEILEVKPIGDVTIRKYENGRVAYVSPAVMGRVVEDHEFDAEMWKLIRDQFDK